MKFFYLNKSEGYVLVTLLSLVFLAACYFFIYLPANEKRVEEQRFRTLQNIDRNIHAKIENSISLLNNLLEPYNKSKDYLKEYIGEYPKEKFILSDISEIRGKDQKLLRDSIDSAPNIEVNDATRQITLQYKKQVGPMKAAIKKGSGKQDTIIIQGSIKFSFKQFIEYLLPDAVFDEYIVFSKGNTVYESFPSGISNAKEDSLLNVKNGVGGSHVKDITVGGKDFKLFIHPVSFDSKNKWILCGLLTKSRYQKERSQLPAQIVMLMVTLVLGMIVIFPWVKLYQIGSKDRLTLADGASSIVVSMLLMSLLFFCFFKYNVGIRSNDSPDSKKTLSAKIANAFHNETEKLYKILKNYDSIRSTDTIEKNIVNFNKPGIALADTSQKKAFSNDTIPTNTKKSLSVFKDSADIRQVFWLDSSGVEKYNWTTESRNAPLGDFKSRNYFKNISEKKAYHLKGDTAKKFFLDQVISWTSGTFTSVLSIPVYSPANHVAAISFAMQSVQDVILPAGYSFAIIDNDGKVLYHSLKSRNLNENIKSEFSDSSNLVSLMNARAEGEFNTNYYSKSYAVLVTPLRDLPYFIIIFSETGFKEIRDVETYSFTFSMLLLLFLYIVLQLFITFLVSSRRSFFKNQLFDTSWIGPRISCHKEYILSSVLNLFVVILLILFFQELSFLQYLFLLLFAVTFISLFLNLLLVMRYRREEKNIYKFKLIAVQWLSVMVIFINVTAFNLLETSNFLGLVFIELAIIAAGLAVLFYGKSIFKSSNANPGNSLSPKWNYTHSFSLMVLTGLIITSGIPVAFFYISSYNYEQTLGIRLRQTDFANRLVEQPQLLQVKNNNANIFYDTTGIYYDHAWISELPEVVDRSSIDTKIKDSAEDKKTQQILGRFRLSISDKAVKTDKLHVPYATDTSVIYQPLNLNKNAENIVTTYRQTGIAGKYVKLSSFKLNYNIPGLFNSTGCFLYYVLLLLALLIFYFIINNIVKKLFCLNLPDLKIWGTLDDKILTYNELNKFVFVIGLPGARKFNDIIKKIQNKEIKYDKELLLYDEKNLANNNVLVADLINIPDTGGEIEKDKDWIKFTQEVVDPKYRLVIINHFEYNIQDEYTNRAKLNLLEQLMLKSKCKILILSTIHPVAFLDSINEPEKQGDTTAKPVHDLERWHVLLGHYRIVVVPITKEPATKEAATKEPETEEKIPTSFQLLCTETDYTHFLKDMQRCTLDIATQLDEEEVVGKTDELAYKLQVTAHYFYMYIWQSLTKEEKFLLYDLAEDNLVNSYDNYNLTMLIAKGVIIHSDGSLRFFNKGFRNFILTAIGPTEATKIKDCIRQNGNWRNLKTPLILVILAILAFLLISQQEAYSKLLTYVAALSAGVPAILKIFSLFDKNASKASS